MDKFLKCDLHMHSSSCYSRKYSENQFIEKIKEVDLDVFSITDHNVVDVSLYKHLKKILGDKKKIIGGVELNLAIDNDTISKNKLTVSESCEYFHAIVWFSIKDLDVFWEALKKLIVYELQIKVDDKSIKEISKLTQGKFFYLNKVQEALKDINYYLVFHEGKSDRNLSDYLKNKNDENEIIAENATFKHNLFYYNNKLAIEGGLKTKKISEYFDEHLNTIVTRFFFSDALKLNDIGKKFTWINFDGDFESLILPFSDPDSRVFVSEEIIENNPQINLDDYLESLKIVFTNKDKSIEREEIFNFSPSLNGIIGSRGSGKTLLGSVLSRTDVSNYDLFIDQSKTQYKMVNGKYKSDAPLSKYLKQNSLLDIFKNGEIKNIDFLKPFYGKQEIEKKQLIKGFIKKASKLIEFEKKQLLELNNKYQGNLKDITFIEQEVNLDNMIPEIEENLFIKGTEAISNFNKSLTAVYNHLGSAKKVINQIETYDETYKEFIELNEVISQFKNQGIIKLSEITKLITETQGIINSYNTADMNNRQALINKYIELIRTVNSTTNKSAHDILNDRKNALDQLVEIITFRAHSKNIFKKISSLLLEIKKETKSEPIPLNEKDELIVSTTIEDLEKYENHINKELKNYNSEFHDEKMFEILLSYNDFNKLKRLFNGNKYKRESSSAQILDKFYDNLLIAIRNNETFDIKLYYNSKNLEEYSPGKKSEILLDIFLDKSILDLDYKYIVLDQPEDNMDTNTITNKLINRLRELKRDIQIFVISHSAAVIINGDSENLIYAYEDNGELHYKKGRIIDEHMKMNIVNTLDGGEKNLKMRLNKYDFKVAEAKK